MLFGVQGVGKSTFGASAPSPIFIPCEDGLNDIDCHRFPLAESFGDVLGAISELYFRTARLPDGCHRLSGLAGAADLVTRYT